MHACPPGAGVLNGVLQRVLLGPAAGADIRHAHEGGRRIRQEELTKKRAAAKLASHTSAVGSQAQSAPLCRGGVGIRSLMTMRLVRPASCRSVAETVSTIASSISNETTICTRTGGGEWRTEKAKQE